ncbi:hypothetical protein DFH09DRAFT_1316641 [Mycena vulgaris]|nr:hypothetical protein DFH09DRAFT_1316641 [Mycena vulgaris]
MPRLARPTPEVETIWCVPYGVCSLILPLPSLFLASSPTLSHPGRSTHAACSAHTPACPRAGARGLTIHFGCPLSIATYLNPMELCVPGSSFLVSLYVIALNGAVATAAFLLGCPYYRICTVQTGTCRPSCACPPFLIAPRLQSGPR